MTRGGDAKVSKLRMRGNVTLPVSFAALSPDVDGLRVSVLGNLFGSIVDDRIPSAGVTGAWALSSSGTKWTFKGESDEDSSVFSGSWVVQVTDRSKKAPNMVAVRVKHTGGLYRFARSDVPPSDMPPVLRILFGSDEEGSAEEGGCEEGGAEEGREEGHAEEGGREEASREEGRPHEGDREEGRQEGREEALTAARTGQRRRARLVRPSPGHSGSSAIRSHPVATLSASCR